MKHRAKRVLSLFFVLIFTLSLPIPAKAADVPSMDNVESVIVLNIENNSFILEKDADKVLFPTATVKLMTALVAYRHFGGNIEQTVTVTQEMKAHYSGRIFDFLVGEQLTLESLLAALLVGGYNDAAVILAYAVSGGLDPFAIAMTDYAKELGATHTVYKNPTGLHHDEMVTTARDTAIIGKHFMENDVLYSLSKRIKYTIPKTNLSKSYDIYSRNSLISTVHSEDYFYSYAQGLCYGSTNEGGDCVVTSGALDGLSYLCIVMGGRPKNENDEVNHAFVVAKNVLRYALANFTVMRLRAHGEAIATLPVRYSATVSEVTVKTAQDLYALVPTDLDTDEDIRFLTEILVESLDAPFEKGKKVGTVKALSRDGSVLGEIDLVTAEGAEAHGFLVFMDKTRDFVTSPLFYMLLILLTGAGVAAYLFLTPKGRKKIRKRDRFDD